MFLAYLKYYFKQAEDRPSWASLQIFLKWQQAGPSWRWPRPKKWPHADL